MPARTFKELLEQAKKAKHKDELNLVSISSRELFEVIDELFKSGVEVSTTEILEGLRKKHHYTEFQMGCLAVGLAPVIGKLQQALTESIEVYEDFKEGEKHAI